MTIRERIEKYGKGPKRGVSQDFCLPCPWCGSEQYDDQPGDDDTGPFDCTACHKSFVLHVNDLGQLETVGMLTEADLKYMEWKAGA